MKPTDNKNREHISEDLKQIWDLAGEYTYPESQRDDMAWNALKNRMNQPAMTVTRKWPMYWKAAAAVTLLAAAGTAFWMFGNNGTKSQGAAEVITTATGPGQLKNVTLPDGSVATLNGNSSIVISGDFGHGNRSITLKGQAYFEVKRNEELPFTVKAGKVQVTVLGTGFDVCAYEGNPSEVRVAHGKVKVATSGTEKILTKGMAVKTSGDELLVAEQEQSVEWSAGGLTFRKATLTEIAAAVDHRFGWKLSFDAVQANRRFTGKFNNNTGAAELAETLSKALQTPVTVK